MRLQQRGLDGRIGFLGEGRVDRALRLGIMRTERRLGRGEALRAVGRQKIERPDGCSDLRPDAIVETHLLEAALHHAVRLDAGRGIVERAGRIEVVDLVRTGVEEETAVGQGIEDRRRRRRNRSRSDRRCLCRSRETCPPRNAPGRRRSARPGPGAHPSTGPEPEAATRRGSGRRVVCGSWLGSRDDVHTPDGGIGPTVARLLRLGRHAAGPA